MYRGINLLSTLSPQNRTISIHRCAWRPFLLDLRMALRVSFGKRMGSETQSRLFEMTLFLGQLIHVDLQLAGTTS